MSTPFLEAFTAALVPRLVEAGLLELDGPQESVARFLATELGKDRPGRSLISTLSQALLACPDVVDVYGEDDELKQIIEGMDTVRG